ncbi:MULTISPECIES: hypothetical protein [unclassified Bradyrhizobium]|uniref:hypothetical protein n=1 Tax=unclassified Bradyrhizobium TaxID=2631580 RepID=UPI001FF73967|nr:MULTISPECIES: hypothetical protein [unclassified Bradyrhizobium]MCK1270825.1 hypothetical protein [Bradyrhizobium sp. 84]MCK1372132.1 hypothetical protein [Bradyrhizobium sp. 49]MCK1430667.1 hypothetical protein [Bradyrhizobium sp. 87]
MGFRSKAGIAAGFLLLAAMGHAHSSELTAAEKAILRKIGEDPEKRVQAAGMLGTNPTGGPKDAWGAVPSARPRERIVHRDVFSELVRKQERPREELPLKRKTQEFSPCAGFKFLLRQDWKDIGFLECPKEAADAVGAEVAFTDDRLNKNRIWSVDGTAALVYTSATSDPDEWWIPYYKTFATYVTSHRSFNSSTALMGSDIDKLAYGVAAEFGWVTDGGANYVRFRGGQVENNIKGTTSANITAEFIPVYFPLYFQRPIIQPLGLPISLRFDPELLVQYSQITGGTNVLDFNGRNQAFRVGPQVSLFVFPETAGTNFLSKLNGSLAYHWAYETYSGKPIDWLQAALTYNIDAAGHLAVAFTYKRGRDEDTGAFADIYRIGLSGKI